MVRAGRLHKYCNADPRYYSNTRQVVPNSQVDERDWHLISKQVETLEEVRTQYETLLQWAKEDREFVRNVKLYEAGEPVWREVE
jgi:hypothetical protein